MVAQLEFVLIVDGDDKFAGDLAVGLRARKAEVEIVPSAEAMFEVIARRRPQMILLSVELPKSKGAGYLACNKLKKDPDKASIPILLMSTTATEEDFAKHRKLTTRANEYVRKPFSDDEFFKKVGNVLGFEISHGEFEQLQEKVHDFLGEKADLEAEIREKAERIAQLELDVAQVRSELAQKHQIDATALQDEQRKMDSLRDQCKTWEATIEQSKRAQAEAEREITAQRTSLEQLQGQFRSLEDTIAECTEKKGLLEAEIELLEGQKQDASLAVEQVQTVGQEIANEIKSLEASKARLLEAINASKRQLASVVQVAREAAASLESAVAGL